MFFRNKNKKIPSILDWVDIKNVANEGLSADFLSQISEKKTQQLQREKTNSALANFIAIAGSEIVGVVAGRVAYALVNNILNDSNKISKKLDVLLSEPLLTGTRIAHQTLCQIKNLDELTVANQTREDLDHQLRSAIDRLETAYTIAKNRKNSSEEILVRTIQGLCEAHLAPRHQIAIEHLKPFLETLDKKGSSAREEYNNYAKEFVLPVKNSFLSEHTFYHLNLKDSPSLRPPFDRNTSWNGIKSKKTYYQNPNFNRIQFPPQQTGSHIPKLKSLEEMRAELNRRKAPNEKIHTNPSKETPKLFKEPKKQKVKVHDIVEGRKKLDFKIGYLDNEKLQKARKAYSSWQHYTGVAIALRNLCDKKGENIQKTLISCPDCHKKLRVPVGKILKITCPSCTCVFEKGT